MMPGLTGEVVLAQIHQEAPNLALITMSGLADDLPPAMWEATTYLTILRKPIASQTLLRTVRQGIDALAAAPTFCS